MKLPIDLSIIVISYNTQKLLASCLASIFTSLKYSYLKYEVIVVDNHSTDGSTGMVQTKYPQVDLLVNQNNLGYGKANNQGIRRARGKVVLLLNSDIFVLDNAIDKLYNFYIKQPQKSIVAGKLLNPDKSPQPSCGPEYNLVTIFTALFLKGDYINLTRYSPSMVKQVDWVMGACMMTSKDTFSDIGWFDESIFMYMEEIDWQYRAKKRGYQVMFYPQARFIHIGAGSSQDRTTPILNVFRGFIYYYYKHHSRAQQLLLRAMLILKSIMAICLFSLLGKKPDRIMYQKALRLVIKL